VEVTGGISGAAARFLAARRDELNRRFEQARRRWPRLEGATVLGLVAQLVAPLAGPEPSADDLCSSVYDLVLLHAGRDTIAIPAVSHLLRTTLPALRPLILARPGALPGALSNAIENVGARGAELSAILATIGPRLSAVEQLADLVAVAAWRLGEARVRGAALRAARRLPAGPALAALGLAGWPEDAAPAVVAALEVDAWTHPRDAISPRALGAIRTAEDGAALSRAMAERPPAPLSKLALVGSAGDFMGFGGTFLRPPVVLDGGDRHTLFARVAEEATADWRLDVDVFGAVASRVEPTKLDVRVLDSTAKRLLGTLVGTGRSDGVRLSADGTLTRGRESIRAPLLAGATSFAILGDAVVTTHAHSHRLRVFAPRRDPL
jgi:hypothetical protein